MTDTQPTRLGKYEILAPLGQGGFGEVFKARDPGLKRIVALKVLHRSLLADPAFLAQFRREAQMAAALQHPHIVTIWEVGEHEGVHFIAMQYVEAGSLDRYLERGRPWPPERILPLAEQIASALDYAHGQRILHLDLKPGNILVSADPRAGEFHAWLADFGLGRLSGDPANPSLVSSPALRFQAGTPAYMAPEQADLETQRQVTPQTDLYAFGVVLYQLCTGRLPFEGHPTAVAAAHVNQWPPRPTLLNGELTQGVEDVLLRALAKSPGARFPSAADLVAALAEAFRTGRARPGVRRVLRAEPLILGDFRVHTLRQLVQACDAAWEEAVKLLYNGALEGWLRAARILAAADEAQRIREAYKNVQGREREKGLEEFLRWAGYATDPVLSVEPELLDFGAEEKGYGYRLQAVLTVRNAGRGLLWGEVKAQAPWLSVVEGSTFIVGPGERHEAIVEAELDALPSGVTQAPAAVAVETPVGCAQVAARMEVMGPVAEITPAELDFGEVREGEPARTVTIANRGAGALEGTVKVAVPWLQVAPPRFRVTAGRTQVLQVRVSASLLFAKQGKLESAVLLETNEGALRLPVRLVNPRGIGLEMVCIPAGEFLMGSDEGKDPSASDDELPQHRVYLDEYWIGKYPVTVAQFAAFVEATGYKTTAEERGSGWAWTGSGWEKVKGANWRQPRGPGSDVRGKADHPVTQVSWHDAVAFCEWASRVTGQRIRLPTEAEWEKAARGADGRLYPWGNQPPTEKLCNFNLNVGDTTPVGRYSPAGDSPYGCADMAGNVWEWCADWYGAKYYASSPSRNPSGPTSGESRVVRGGSWNYYQWLVRAARRHGDSPDVRFGYLGFRCALSP